MLRKLYMATTITGLSLFVNGCATNQSQVESTVQSSSAITSTSDATTVPVESNYTVAEDFRIIPLENSQATNKVVLLTFDDAPDQYSLEIAQQLKEKNVSAIFFVNGHFMDERGKEIVKQLDEMGFEIGNHTQTHPFLTDLSYEEQVYEITTTSDTIEEVTGKRPRFFRPPFGAYDDNTLTIVNEQNMLLMTWTYGYDWQEDYQDAAALTEITVNAPELSDGANILMHDRKWTSEAIGSIVDGLQKNGYTVVNPASIQLPE